MSNSRHTFFGQLDHPPNDNCFECYQPYPDATLPPILQHQQHHSTPYLAELSEQTTPIASHMNLYSLEQLETICTSLFQSRDGDRLVTFFHQIGQSEAWRSERILVAYAYALYHANEFDTLFNILSTRTFSPEHFNDLQEIWHNARYKESQIKRGKELNPVEKYRLRRKYPPPKTIWDGEETVYSFKENSRKYLKQFYKQNAYPSLEQKREISRVTGLRIIQISNWFKNRRQRDKPPSKGSPESSSSSTGNASEFSRIISPHSFNMAAAAAYSSIPLNVGMFYDPNPDQKTL
ncbi:unnamed protein product [Caenorhabditis bovis]|uniref:Homeobox domain-containing protein n=1 Tax=Caenorhabditis bovis TaxID=2654633 RepID=A0A8S1EHV2_9PELO|nr:unnamed protein product [Caenorhabditis bovis]